MSQEQVATQVEETSSEVEAPSFVVFCLGCKRRSVVSKAREEENKGGRKIIKGECGYEDCKKPVTRFLEKN